MVNIICASISCNWPFKYNWPHCRSNVQHVYTHVGSLFSCTRNK